MVLWKKSLYVSINPHFKFLHIIWKQNAVLGLYLSERNLSTHARCHVIDPHIRSHPPINAKHTDCVLSQTSPRFFLASRIVPSTRFVQQTVFRPDPNTSLLATYPRNCNAQFTSCSLSSSSFI